MLTRNDLLWGESQKVAIINWRIESIRTKHWRNFFSTNRCVVVKQLFVAVSTPCLQAVLREAMVAKNCCAPSHLLINGSQANLLLTPTSKLLVIAHRFLHHRRVVIASTMARGAGKFHITRYVGSIHLKLMTAASGTNDLVNRMTPNPV